MGVGQVPPNIQPNINPISGAGDGGQPASGQQVANGMEQAIAGMNDALQVIDSEVAAKTDMKKSENLDKAQQSSTSTTQAQQKEVPPSALPEEILAFLTSQTDDVKKKKRKKSSFEEKMEELAELEGNIDTSNMSPEEKEVIEQFYDNMARIKNLKSKFKRVQHQRESLEELVEEEKRKEELEKQRELEKAAADKKDSNQQGSKQDSEDPQDDNDNHDDNDDDQDSDDNESITPTEFIPPQTSHHPPQVPPHSKKADQGG